MALPVMTDLALIKGEGLQTRVTLDEQTILDYAEIYREDEFKMPPVEVTRVSATDELLLTDGFHRVEAARRAGRTRIRCNVTAGTPVQALAAALRANAAHGLRRTNADKRKALEMAWENRMELFGGEPSHDALAEACGVSRNTARRFREDDAGVPNGHPCQRVGTDGKRYSAPAESAPCGLLLDKVGQEVPPRLVPTFRSKAALQALNKLARFLGELESVREDPERGGEMAWMDARQIADIGSWLRNLRLQRPYAVCPSCGGEGCRDCSGYGFLPKRKFETLSTSTSTNTEKKNITDSTEKEEK